MPWWAIILALLVAGIGAYKFINGKVIWEFVSAALVDLIKAALPSILKFGERMPEDEEQSWNDFMKTNPDKYEIVRWRKEYRKRKKEREGK